MAFEKIDGTTIVEVKQVESRVTLDVNELKRIRDAHVQKRALLVANHPIELARIDAKIAQMDDLLAEAAKLGVVPAEPEAAQAVEKLPK